jgi:hypothetical protein
MHDPWRGRSGGEDAGRIVALVIGGVILFIFLGMMAGSCSNRNSPWDNSAVTWSSSDYSYSSGGSSVEQTAVPANTVPWDYRVVEGTVGDLIGSDMTILPDNQLLPNDNNYGTGDKIWTLQYMEATMQENTAANGRSSITLSSWKPIKSYKTKEAAQQDIAKLKIRLKTEIDLIGVYKTEYQGQTRQFAVLTLPSGNAIKQPIDAKKYAQLKPLKKASVYLEEVHDFADYDKVYSKFRGWAA